MDKLYFIFDEQGNFITQNYFSQPPEGGVCIEDNPITESFIKIKYDWQNLCYYEGATQEEIAQINEEKRKTYTKEVYEIYNKLYLSSLARAVNKVGQGLTGEELLVLKQEYEDKKTIAEEYLTTGIVSNEIMLQEISFQMEQDYPDNALNNRIDELNNLYSLNISKEGSRLQRYCRIVVAVYNLGIYLWNVFKPLCSTFRSSMLTSIESNDFNSYNLKKSLVLSLTNESTLQDIITLSNQFKDI